MTGAPATCRRLLAVFAHPDDEALAAGGLLASAADAGAHVALVCLTRGEDGGGAGASPDAGRRLAGTRTRELAAAAAVLGVRDVQVLDHPDGMLPWAPAAQVEHDIQAAIARLTPDAVVTFGPDGLYWHPDHIAVHERTTAAVAGLGGAAPALYYVTMPPGQMRAVADDAVSRGAPPWVVRGLDDPDAFGALAETPTFVLDASAAAPRKVEALRCHGSQVGGGALDGLDDAAARRLFGVEHYRRAPVGPTGEGPLERLLGRLAASPVARE
ncbi:MAG: PIG-L deacetylase family protein [Vicinamibacterales bacterium]